MCLFKELSGFSSSPPAVISASRNPLSTPKTCLFYSLSLSTLSHISKICTWWPSASAHMMQTHTPLHRGPYEDRVRMHLLTLLRLSAFRSCTIRTATGMRTVSAAPSATSRWPASRSTPGTMARSCVASAAPGRTATGARAATRWSCQVGFAC